MSLDSQPPDQRVLILTPTGRDAALAAGALAAAGLRAEVCADVDTLCRALTAEAGAALVADEALTPPALQRLSETLARQPPWSDLPFIVLTSGGTAMRERRGQTEALNALGNATLLERPLRVATLAHAVQAALGARRRQYEVRAHLEERARLEAALQAEYAKQRQIAETLQRSLLDRPSRERLLGLEVETVYQPARSEADIGGDFYDAFALQGTRVALVVGDVSGKGLEAASRTAEVKYALRAYLREYPAPAPALDRVNDYLLDAQALDGRPLDGFVCISLCVLDMASGLLTVASAGAEPPLVLRADGGAESVPGNGPPLGVTAQADYVERHVGLAPGDTVLMATDGITEARRGRDFFGYEGMTGAAQAAGAGVSLGALGQAILSGALAYTGGQLSDDVCLLIARHTRGTPA